jgi:hypothetical protein
MTTDSYTAFLASKKPRPAAVGIVPKGLHPGMFDFQASVTDFALRQGRCGMYLGAGLGKSFIQLEFSDKAMHATNGWALIWTPLAVARQMEREGQARGYDCRVIRDQSEARPGINICNYDRQELIDPDAYGSVCFDEAGIFKNFSGRTTTSMTAAFKDHRFKMAATATPAPNDHMEIGTQSELLNAMNSNEMLSRFFINDTATASQMWRLKKHAETAFWEWMASWSRMAESPDDLGFDGSRYVLPELKVIRHRAAYGEVKPMDGSLFTLETSATAIHGVKRQTAGARADSVAELAGGNNDTWLVWADTDYECDAIKERIPGILEVRGSMTIDRKEENLAAFIDGSEKRLLTKPSVAGWGLNLQFCHLMAFAGRSFSYEAWYQAVRRCWRFGQDHAVEAHVIVAEGEDQIGRVIDRKADDHAKMKKAMAIAMRSAITKNSERMLEYNPEYSARFPSWLT